MKDLSFFLGFFLLFIGVEPAPETPIWMILPVVGTGLAMLWWGALPKSSKNRYVK